MLAMILLQPNFKLKLTSFLCAQGQEEFGAHYFALFLDNMTESCVEQSVVAARSGSFFSSLLCAHVCVCHMCSSRHTHCVILIRSPYGQIIEKNHLVSSVS